MKHYIDRARVFELVAEEFDLSGDSKIQSALMHLWVRIKGMKAFTRRQEEGLDPAQEIRESWPEWRSTEVEVPPDDEPVLAVVWANGGSMKFVGAYCMAEYREIEGWMLTDWPELELERVTHWMPLPEPPKEEKANGQTVR